MPPLPLHQSPPTLEPKTPYGLYVYVGVPESGKTTWARKHLEDLISSNGLPGLIVDSEGAGNLEDIPYFPKLGDALREVFKAGRNARWIPENKEEVSLLCEAVRHNRYCNLYIDEVAYYAKAGRIPEPLEHLIRAHRHLKVNILMTSQYITDFAPFVRSCATEVYAFRIHDPVALKYLYGYFGFEPQEIKRLDKGDARRWTRWDSWGVIEPPAVKGARGRPRRYHRGDGSANDPAKGNAPENPWPRERKTPLIPYPPQPLPAKVPPEAAK